MNLLLTQTLRSGNNSSLGKESLSELESDLECCGCSYICRYIALNIE